MLIRSAAALATAFVALATPALAATPLQVTSRMLVERRVAHPDGTTRVEQVAANRAVPGDRVTVTVDYRNTGSVPLANVAIANPVPQGLVFRAATTPGLEVSVDGARFAPLGSLTVPAPTGARPARTDDVSAVRWRLPTSLAPGAAGQFSFLASIK